jgi:hypothetical protein
MKMTPVDPCDCGEPHHPGAHYYVSVRSTPSLGAKSPMRLAAGPFGTHAEARAWVAPVKGLVFARYNPHGKAAWYGYGTVAVKSESATPGILNAELGILVPEEVTA